MRLRQIGLALALTLGGASLRASAVDECATAVLSCEKSKTGDSEYKCVALAQMPRKDDFPQYEWKVSAGRIVDGDKTPNVTIETRGVKTSTLLVTVRVTWRKAPRACRSTILKKEIGLR
jgi:hypothetical protein